MHKFLYVFISLTLVFGLNEAICPPGTFEGLRSEYPGTITCYWFWNELKDWQTSSDLCWSLGWNVTSIHDAFTNKFLQQKLLSLTQNSTSPNTELVWLGAEIDIDCTYNSTFNCNNGFLEYVWDDFSTFDYQNIAPGHGATDDSQNLAFNVTSGQWYAVEPKFNQVHPYLCSRIYPKNFTSPKCPQGAFHGLVVEDCYMPIEQPLPWHDAQLDCISKNGTLTSIHNPRNNELIQKKLSQISSQTLFWIGAESYYYTDTYFPRYEYMWFDQSDFNYCPNNNGCDPSGANQSLAIGAKDGFWYTQNWDGVKLPYLCKVPAIY